MLTEDWARPVRWSISDGTPKQMRHHVVAHELLDSRIDLGEHRLFVRSVGLPDLPLDDNAFTVDQPGEELRPAEVHPDDVLVCHLVNRIGTPGPRLP